MTATATRAWATVDGNEAAARIAHLLSDGAGHGGDCEASSGIEASLTTQQ